MTMSKPLVFFGTEDFSLQSLQALLDAGWNVVAVVTKPDTRRGRGQNLEVPKVKRLAEAHGVAVFQPQDVKDINSQLGALGAEHAVLVAYGKIIPASTIDIFPGGIINVHPSLLPRYRGPSPIEAAILNGDKQTGISLMRLTPEMDAGPLYYQLPFPLNGKEDRLTLSAELAKKGAEVLISKLPAIVGGDLLSQPQDDSGVTYTRLLNKEDGTTDWQEPAQLLERKVRASLGFPKLKGTVMGHQVVVNKTRVAISHADGNLVIKCRPGWLEIIELTAPSGRIISGAEFLRGYKKT